VLRDGKHIGTLKRDKTNPNKIISMMVGRSLETAFPKRTSRPGELILSVRGLTRYGEFEDVSFDLHRGEIIGFAGLIGAGRTELVKAIFGATKLDKGEIILHGEKTGPFLHPQYALSNGLAYLSEDRKGEGLMLQLSVRENITLSILKKLSKYSFIKYKNEKSIVEDFVSRFRIKLASIEQVMESLSGGNQQKVVISRLLLTEASVFILDEPTRGIDVGAKYEIYRIMNDLTAEGKGIIFISSELPEVIGISDRILCMREGRLVRTFSREEATEEDIMRVLQSISNSRASHSIVCFGIDSGFFVYYKGISINKEL